MIRAQITFILSLLVLLSSCATTRNNKEKKKEILNFTSLYEQNIEFKRNELYFKASAAMLEGNYAEANKLFEALLPTEGENSYLLKKYAVSLIKNSKIKKAKPILMKVFKNSSYKDEQVGLILAGVQTTVGDVDAANKTYQVILKNNPMQRDACVFLGKSYALNKKTSKAVKLLSSCSKRVKGEGIFDYYIGKIYVEKRKLNKARSYFLQALKKEPSYAQAALGVGLVYEEQKKEKQAVAFYKKFLKSNNDAVILERLVSLYFVQQKYKEVIPYAERLSDLDSSNLNLRVKLGILYTDTKQYQKAINIFKSLIVVSPDNDKLLYYLGAIYQEVKEFEQSIEYYSRINTQSGLYSDSSLQVAQMLMKLAKKNESQEGRFVEFINKKSLEITNLAVDFKVIEANYFDSRGMFAKAIESLQDVVALESFNISHKFFLATLYEKEKKFNQAYGIMNSILDKDQNNAHALNFIGYSLVERELELDKAYRYIKKAIALKPQDGYIRDSLGWYYYKVGNIKKALKELKLASSQVKDDVSILKHLAIVYSKLKKFDLAKKYLKDAIKFTSSESQKQEMLEALKHVETNRFPASLK